MLDVQQEKDLTFDYKDIRIIATKQVVAIVSKVKLTRENTSAGIKLKLLWE